LQSVAAIIVQQRVLIDYRRKDESIGICEGHLLDHIGSTLRFEISAIQPQSVTIPAGLLNVDVVAECTEPGIKENSYQPGQIIKY